MSLRIHQLRRGDEGEVIIVRRSTDVVVVIDPDEGDPVVMSPAQVFAEYPEVLGQASYVRPWR